MHSVASLNLRRGFSDQSARKTPRRASFTFPDRFKDDSDAHTDVTAPQTTQQRYANQSFLSMIANVGSNIPVEPQAGLDNNTIVQSKNYSKSSLSKSVKGPKIDPETHSEHEAAARASSGHGDLDLGREDSDVLQSSAEKEPLDSDNDQNMDNMSSSLILPARGTLPEVQDTPAYKDQSMQASRGEDGQSDSRPANISSSSIEASSVLDGAVQRSSDLAARVAEVFGFQKLEDIITEMPCWLVQNIVVNGRIYVTPAHICFYAFLPRKTNVTTKSGFFLKRGPRNPRYHRYWFVLRGNVLSYHQNASSLYFPLGTIDLRTAISAQLEKATDDGTGRGFSITTSQRMIRFKAESITNAQEWVKKIQQAIFHSHNVGNSVKICLPLRNIIETEDNPLFERWETLKIKAVDTEESFAVDEYFFSFMNHDNEPLDLLRKTVMSDPFHQKLAEVRRNSKATNDGFDDQPLSSLHKLDTSPKQHSTMFASPSRSSVSHALSSESYDEVRDISAAEASDSDSHEPLSASRILKGSGIFHQKRFQSSTPSSTTSGVIRDKIFPASSDAGPLDPQARMADSQSTVHPSTSSSRIESIVRASSASIHKASGIADILRTSSKRVSEVIASESKTYYDKVTNMWLGRVVHFDHAESPMSQDNIEESQVRHPDTTAGDRFRNYFALSEHEKLEATYHGFLLSNLPIYGKLYLGNRKLCFRALVPGMRTKMILPLRDIITVDKVKGINLGYSGLVIIVRGHEELFLEFGHPEARDDLAVTLQKRLSNSKEIEDSRVMTEEDVRDLDVAQKEYDALEEAHRNLPRRGDDMFESIAIDEDEEVSPVIFDDIEASIIDFKPPKSLRVVCLTIGSRGDVQPYIALCQGLKKDGHHPLIATHDEYEPWIRKHGIDFASVAGNPAEIMQLCVENDMFTINFFREINTKMRPWFDRLLGSAWKACQGADLLIESPSAMAGIHIAQALEIPYFRAFSMIWTRTRAYPHPFIVPKQKLGGNYNYLSYVIVDKFLWQASAYQVNKWRTKTLQLPPTSLERLKVHSVPFLYNFSQSVVSRPLDFSPWIHVTGNWFLDESQGYEPPEDLADFIDRARGDGKKLVYVGFGSMVIENRAATTKTIVDSVLKADVRCIFSKGWSDRLQGPYDTAEIAIPSELIVIKSAPHDWLFKEIDVAVHHGGAGTTAASLRAGIPTIVKPFFGDQRFYGARVEDLGVGRCLELFNTSLFSRALWEATHNERIIEKARALGEQIRSEDGVANAIQTIYRDMEYAKSLIRYHTGQKNLAEEGGEEGDDADDGSTQEWTMVNEDFAEGDE